MGLAGGRGAVAVVAVAWSRTSSAAEIPDANEIIRFRHSYIGPTVVRATGLDAQRIYRCV